MAGIGEICRVGYALHPKKLRRGTGSSGDGRDASPARSAATNVWRGGGLADILEMEPTEGDLVQFSAWEIDSPAEQPAFHVIIHKLTEDIDRAEASPKLTALEAYLKHNPTTVIVDPIDCVRKVISRARTCHHLQTIQTRLAACCPFRQPSFMLIDKQTDAEIICDLEEKGISFPLICKPVEACGTPNSHSMVIIISAKDIHLTPRPCVIQQYHDHDGLFYKVYVIDQAVSAYRRPSLPNIQQHASACHSIVFDSRQCYPTLATFLDAPSTSSEESTDGCLEAPEELRMQLEQAAAALREEFGLSLFGFDVILPHGGLPMVIDVNYFPSYKEVSDFPSRLRKYLRGLAFQETLPSS